MVSPDAVRRRPMKVVRFADRVRVWAKVMAHVRHLPRAVRLRNLLVPVDVVRYEESTSSCASSSVKDLRPTDTGRRRLMMAHVLASGNNVIKTT
jgi:hypothetical protein